MQFPYIICVLDYVDGAEVDGATLVLNESFRNVHSSVASEDSDSDDYGPQPGVQENSSNSAAAISEDWKQDKSNYVGASAAANEGNSDVDEDGIDSSSANQLSKEEAFDRFAVENKIPISHQVKKYIYSIADFC